VLSEAVDLWFPEVETTGPCDGRGSDATIDPDAVPGRKDCSVVQLTRLVGECEDGECPTLYASDRGTLVVQGSLLMDRPSNIPAHEGLVEIPVDLIRKAIRGNFI
jgi:hypothetical protein